VAGPLTIRQPFCFGDIVNAGGAQPEAGEDLHQMIRGHHDGGGKPHQAPCHGPMRQVIPGASVVIVEDGWLP